MGYVMLKSGEVMLTMSGLQHRVMRLIEASLRSVLRDIRRLMSVLSASREIVNSYCNYITTAIDTNVKNRRISLGR